VSDNGAPLAELEARFKRACRAFDARGAFAALMALFDDHGPKHSRSLTTLESCFADAAIRGAFAPDDHAFWEQLTRLATREKRTGGVFVIEAWRHPEEPRPGRAVFPVAVTKDYGALRTIEVSSAPMPGLHLDSDALQAIEAARDFVADNVDPHDARQLRERHVWVLPKPHRPEDEAIEGKSLGLAAAVAFASWVMREPVQPGMAFTGVVTRGGEIKRVKEISRDAKLEALSQRARPLTLVTANHWPVENRVRHGVTDLQLVLGDYVKGWAQRHASTLPVGGDPETGELRRALRAIVLTAYRPPTLRQVEAVVGGIEGVSLTNAVVAEHLGVISDPLFDRGPWLRTVGDGRWAPVREIDAHVERASEVAGWGRLGAAHRAWAQLCASDSEALAWHRYSEAALDPMRADDWQPALTTEVARLCETDPAGAARLVGFLAERGVDPEGVLVRKLLAAPDAAESGDGPGDGLDPAYLRLVGLAVLAQEPGFPAPFGAIAGRLLEAADGRERFLALQAYAEALLHVLATYALVLYRDPGASNARGKAEGTLRKFAERPAIGLLEGLLKVGGGLPEVSEALQPLRDSLAATLAAAGAFGLSKACSVFHRPASTLRFADPLAAQHAGATDAWRGLAGALAKVATAVATCLRAHPIALRVREDHVALDNGVAARLAEGAEGIDWSGVVEAERQAPELFVRVTADHHVAVTGLVAVDPAHPAQLGFYRGVVRESRKDGSQVEAARY
jgi:hypothetical protein